MESVSHLQCSEIRKRHNRTMKSDGGSLYPIPVPSATFEILRHRPGPKRHRPTHPQVPPCTSFLLQIILYSLCTFKHSSVSPRDASTILSISLRHPNTTSPAPAIAAPIYSSSPSTTPYISYPIHSRPDSHDGPITFQDGEANKIQGVILLGSRRQSRINHNLLSIKPLFPLASRRSILPCRLTRCFTTSQRW